METNIKKVQIHLQTQAHGRSPHIIARTHTMQNPQTTVGFTKLNTMDCTVLRVLTSICRLRATFIYISYATKASSSCASEPSCWSAKMYLWELPANY